MSARAIRMKKLGRFLYRAQRGACCICGAPMNTGRTARGVTPDAYTIEHCQPRSLGGRDDVRNLRLSHRRCNSNRGAKDVAWYPLPCYRPRALRALHLVAETLVTSRYRHWEQRVAA